MLSYVMLYIYIYIYYCIKSKKLKMSHSFRFCRHMRNKFILTSIIPTYPDFDEEFLY